MIFGLSLRSRSHLYGPSSLEKCYRLKKRTCKLHYKKKKKKKKKKRNCFLQGPCTLCFIVHSNSGGHDDDQLETGINGGSGKGGHCHSNTSDTDYAKFLLSPPELAIWEDQGRSLLSAVPAKLIPPPALFRSAGVPVPIAVAVAVSVPSGASDYAEMVCKRKCAAVQRCTPFKQPRCAFPIPEGGLENGGGGGDASSNTGTGHCHLLFCPLPSSSSSSSSSSTTEGCCGMALHGDSLPQSSDSSTFCPYYRNDCQGRGCDLIDTSSINRLSSSILVFSHLLVKERCLCAWVVCKYRRDLCLDFQFWKEIDLSGLQRVNDDLLVKVASWRQNVTELNISDYRGVQDHGVCSLATHCHGLQRYTANRCKQLSDLITDEGMVSLAKGCPKLQIIYMQENKLPCESLSVSEPCESLSVSEPCESLSVLEPCESLSVLEPCESLSVSEPCVGAL
ncbi:unnamed protein product [Coregonus sp. 'balchen']|nr:unnamed protein product [Coregonus sp. 'balchen']